MPSDGTLGSMDALDETIIGALQTNARASFASIGREVGLSTNAVAARVRRLEMAGVILGYRVLLSADAPDPGSGLEAFIDVRLAADADSEAFLAWTATVAAISDAVHVTGPFDYLLRVRFADTAALDRLLRRLKTEAGAAQTSTRLALGR